MKTRKLGWTDLELSEVGLGTWVMGGPGWTFSWGYQDDLESKEAIKRAADLGVNWIDTAAAYGLGHAEELVRDALDGIKQKPLIATKFSMRWDGEGNIYSCLEKSSIKDEVENSLRRLGVETIDLYQMHWPRPEEGIEEAWDTVTGLVREGKVRYAGVCNCSVEQMQRLQPIHPIASLQPPYNLLRRGIESGILQYCEQNQIGVIVYSPMQKGLLTDKISKSWAESLSSEDRRRKDTNFQEPLLSKNVRLVEELSPIARKYGRSMAELAVAWVLRRSEVTSAIVGARRPSQIEETVCASEWILSEEDQNTIEQVLAQIYA